MLALTKSSGMTEEPTMMKQIGKMINQFRNRINARMAERSIERDLISYQQQFENLRQNKIADGDVRYQYIGSAYMSLMQQLQNTTGLSAVEVSIRHPEADNIFAAMKPKEPFRIDPATIRVVLISFLIGSFALATYLGLLTRWFHFLA